MVFDNSKIKSLVPSFQGSIPFAEGAREIVRWHDAHPAMQKVDAGFMELSDRLVGWVRRP